MQTGPVAGILQISLAHLFISRTVLERRPFIGTRSVRRDDSSFYDTIRLIPFPH